MLTRSHDGNRVNRPHGPLILITCVCELYMQFNQQTSWSSDTYNMYLRITYAIQSADLMFLCYL